MSKIPFYLSRIRAKKRENGLRAAAVEAKRILKQVSGSVYYENIPTDPSVIWGDWDVCIVLDACRPDLLAELSDEYAFLPDRIPTTLSVGGTSTEWMESTFDAMYREYTDETAYVTGNPYTDEHPQLKELALLDEVWRYAWDTDLGTQPPRPITDRAITVWRKRSSTRMVVHYMQPHFPSIPDQLDSRIELESFGEEWPNSIWDQLETGDVSVERAWTSYRENCRYVLNEVDLLLQNVDAPRVIVTADHGNAFGEWGFYGHPGGVHIPAVREVPQVETTATDEETHTPDTYESRDEVDTTVSERLSDLGYRDV